MEESNCTTERCFKSENSTKIYLMIECTTDYESVLHDKLPDGDYLLESSYSFKDCSGWSFLIAYTLDGKCRPIIPDGSLYAETTFNSDDSVTFNYFNDSMCRDYLSKMSITSVDVATHTCEVTSDSSTTYNNTYEILTLGGSAGIGIGAIIGIVAGCIVLLLSIAGFVIWRYRHMCANKSEIPLDLEVNHQKRDDHYQYIDNTPTAHPSTIGDWSTQETRGTTISMSGGLWDDDVIVAARIPRDRVIVESLISRGGYGEVYRGIYNSQPVAVKMLLPERRKMIRHVNDFLAEVKMMSNLEHPRIVEFVGVAWDSLANLCVVSEFMAGGDLRAMLAAFESRHHPMGFDYDKVKIAMHVVHALTYLHSLQPMVLHRDLKSRNILLDTELNAKLTDFGVSRERSDSTMTAGVGTSLWMAPEVMMGEHYDDKADMFSFGIVLSELDSHALPYASTKDPNDSSRRLPPTAIVQQIMLGNLHVQFSSAAPRAIVKLGNACVAADPNLRPTAAAALYKLHQIMRDM